MKIITDLPFSVTYIKKLKIIQRLNNHGIAFISGLSNEEAKEAIDTVTWKKNVTIKKISSSGKESILFCGIPCSMKIKHTSGVTEWYLLLKSGSVLMDFQKKNKSFQNVDTTYKKLLETIIKSYHGDLFDAFSKGRLQKQPLIQYEETDWEFIKRASSLIGAPVFPDITCPLPRIYLGMPNGDRHSDSKINESIIKNSEDSLYCHFHSTKEYQIGDTISDGSLSVSVTEKVICLRKGILSVSYRGLNQKGISRKPENNQRLQGVSIAGTVIAVKKDQLKVHLSIDNSQMKSEAFWFPFCTPYAAEGTAGFYTMPETGENVNLYFPTCKEKDAVVWYTNRLDSSDNEKVHTPSVKRFGTSHGKEIKLSPNQISFTAAKNQLLLTMNETNGIDLKSHQNIHLKASKRLLSRCQTLEMESQDKIILATPSSSIIVDDIVHIKS